MTIFLVGGGNGGSWWWYSLFYGGGLTLAFTSTGEAQQSRARYMVGCDKRSCYPATGNLLIGREDMLTANDTCGADRQERYCVISSLDGRSNKKNTKCDICDASDPTRAHPVAKIVHKYEPPENPRSQQHLTWWQGPNGKTGVTITLNLEAEFHVTHVIITFKTFRYMQLLLVLFKQISSDRQQCSLRSRLTGAKPGRYIDISLQTVHWTSPRHT